MTNARKIACRALIAAIIVLTARHAAADDKIPADLQGEWVPASGDCTATSRLKAAESTLTLINGKDSQTYGNLGIPVPSSFFGPDYEGISVVVMPEIDSGNSPFTVFFNNDEKKGVAQVEIYREIKGPQNAQVKAIQDAAKKLAGRFPGLNLKPLKKCP